MSTHEPMIGHEVAGRYELVKLLGEGGMGAVYEAVDLETGRGCAVKLLLNRDVTADSDLVRRFFREAKACASIESQHVVGIYASETDVGSGLPFIAMELLEGEDLSALIHRVGALPPQTAATIVYQVAMGLAEAHAAGIVHRDIKPANLFLAMTREGEIVLKVLDFGVAKVKMHSLITTRADLTRSGAMIGTPRYMSPEQARGLPDIDARSDVWSLGVVLYELLSGTTPFDRATAFGDLLVAISCGMVPLIQDVAPWIPPELAEITHRALARQPDQRYPSGAAMRDALEGSLPSDRRLMSSMLVPMHPDQRTLVAPRARLEGLSSCTTHMASVSAIHGFHHEAPSWRHKIGLLVGLALGVSTLTAGMVAVVVRYSMKAVESNQPSASASETPVPKMEDKTFHLLVGPVGVGVTVDGVRAEVRDGKVEVIGPVGAIRKVKVSIGGLSEETVVAIAQLGLVPSELRISIASPPALSSSVAEPASPVSRVHSKVVATSRPSPSSPGSLEPPPVSTDTTEFQ